MTAQINWINVCPRVRRAVGGPVDVNLVMVEGNLAVLVVDTGSTAGEGAGLRRAVEAELRGREVVVVNTHAHYDHCFGNSAFRGWPVWGSSGCIRALAAMGTAQREREASHWNTLAPTFARELEAAPIFPPTSEVRSRKDLDLGGITAELVAVAPAHTDHDLLVHLPALRTVLAGDIVEESGPPSLKESFPLNWPSVLDDILALEPALVVPGHGREVDSAFVARQRQELVQLADWCVEHLGAGDLPLPPPGPFHGEQLHLALKRARLEVGLRERASQPAGPEVPDSPCSETSAR